MIIPLVFLEAYFKSDQLHQCYTHHCNNTIISGGGFLLKMCLFCFVFSQFLNTKRLPTQAAKNTRWSQQSFPWNVSCCPKDKCILVFSKKFSFISHCFYVGGDRNGWISSCTLSIKCITTLKNLPSQRNRKQICLTTGIDMRDNQLARKEAHTQKTVGATNCNNYKHTAHPL